ncbi:DUF1440 domain-containing protein [Sphingomonas canadensis]|uniref:DUF1440 domain-containing protein n=1 Tax=Sphingomonas canadensis TaxID=1219257 RepID=A0ABW3GZR2_9SPHN|nr:DUF1440 domain-containing protein [Sphingomonas canadensis]MCW3835374.1 DUF1440 domain-containing protein [Sphingomonas canadensis]
MAEPRPLIGLAAGALAGLIAAAALAAIEAAPPPAGETAAEEDGAEPEALPAVTAPPARGDRVRYIAGAVLGGIYGLIAEYKPEARDGFAPTFGIATAALLDPLAPEDAAVEETHPAGPLAFGAVLEGIRALIAGRR